MPTSPFDWTNPDNYNWGMPSWTPSMPGPLGWIPSLYNIAYGAGQYSGAGQPLQNWWTGDDWSSISPEAMNYGSWQGSTSPEAMNYGGSVSPGGGYDWSGVQAGAGISNQGGITPSPWENQPPGQYQGQISTPQGTQYTINTMAGLKGGPDAPLPQAQQNLNWGQYNPQPTPEDLGGSPGENYSYNYDLGQWYYQDPQGLLPPQEYYIDVDGTPRPEQNWWELPYGENWQGQGVINWGAYDPHKWGYRQPKPHAENAGMSTYDLMQKYRNPALTEAWDQYNQMKPKEQQYWRNKWRYAGNWKEKAEGIADAINEYNEQNKEDKSGPSTSNWANAMTNWRF